MSYFGVGAFFAFIIVMLMVVAPFVPKLRKALLSIDGFDETLVGCMFEAIEEREIEHLGHGMLLILIYFLWLIFGILAYFVSILAYPVIILGLIGGLIIKNNYPKQK